MAAGEIQVSGGLTCPEQSHFSATPETEVVSFPENYHLKGEREPPGLGERFQAGSRRLSRVPMNPGWVWPCRPHPVLTHMKSCCFSGESQLPSPDIPKRLQMVPYALQHQRQVVVTQQDFRS